MPLDWTPFVELVRRHGRFLLTTHVRPDGDGLGSQLALAEVLESLGKEVQQVIASNWPPRYNFLDPDRHIEHFSLPGEKWKQAEAVIILDTGTWTQLGDFGTFLKGLPVPRLVIDHHLTQDVEAVRLVDTTAEATGRLVYEAVSALGVPLSPRAAELLFCALATDTGWFRHRNMKPASFALAEKLFHAGAQPTLLYERLFEENTLGKLKLTALVLDRLQVIGDGKVAYIEILRDDYAKTGALPPDTEDLINFPRSVAGVEVALVFMEQPAGGTKISFRSREKVDVARLAEKFGGGGHRLASGAIVQAPLDDARRDVLAAVTAALQPDRASHMSAKVLPTSIRDENHLEDLLSAPSDAALAAIGRLRGDVMILGVGGKMGPSLARMVRRAADAAGTPRRVIGVARFSSPGLEEQLHAWGIETVRCDLLDPAQVDRLPDAPNVVAMTGMKFGSSGQEALTWAMNAYLPALICGKYRRSRIVAFSTGNVYGLTPVSRGGSLETDPLQPVGEYSMSALGRERMYEHFSRTWQIPMAIVRLNYATEMRYGVLVDIAHKVLAGEPVDLGMGHLNALWQADANAMAVATFDHLTSPPFRINLAGPEVLSVRQVATEFGRLLDRPVSFRGREGDDAFLSNSQHAQTLFGAPRVSAFQMVTWITDWVQRGGRSLGKPTHFEVRDGKF